MNFNGERFYESLMGHSPVATVFLNTEGRVIACNPAFEKLFGYPKADVLGKDIDDLVTDPGSLSEALVYTKRILSGGETVRATGTRRTNTGQLINVEMQGMPIVEGSRTHGVLVLYNDITTLTAAQKSTQNVLNSLSTILDSLDADVYVADMETFKILFMNRHMSSIFGGNLTGQICHKVFRNEEHPCAHCSNSRLINEKGEPTGVYVWEGENPVTQTWYKNFDRAIPWEDGRLVRLQIAFDITDLKQAEAKLAHVATHDPLTKLPNRVVFQDRLAHAVSVGKRAARGVAVLFVDLDGFKLVNDTHGHTCGDELLKSVALRMHDALRECDTLARLSGDEFAVVLENNADSGVAEIVANRILKAIAEPFLFYSEEKEPSSDNREASVTASIGIALLPHHSDDPDELLRLADEAMYKAKRCGKNSVWLAGSSP